VGGSARTDDLVFHLLLPHDTLVLGHGHGDRGRASIGRLDVVRRVLWTWEVEDLELLVGAKSLSIAKRDSLTYRSCCELAQNGDSKQALSKFSVFFQADADIWLGMLRVGA